MAERLKDLNKQIRRKKAANKKAPPSPPPPPPPSDVERIAAALERAQAPVVNMPARKPVGYDVEVTQRSSATGDIMKFRVTPIREGD